MHVHLSWLHVVCMLHKTLISHNDCQRLRSTESKARVEKRFLHKNRGGRHLLSYLLMHEGRSLESEKGKTRQGEFIAVVGNQFRFAKLYLVLEEH